MLLFQLKPPFFFAKFGLHGVSEEGDDCTEENETSLDDEANIRGVGYSIVGANVLHFEVVLVV